jgi:hypothetical protein
LWFGVLLNLIFALTCLSLDQLGLVLLSKLLVLFGLVVCVFE